MNNPVPCNPGHRPAFVPDRKQRKAPPEGRLQILSEVSEVFGTEPLCMFLASRSFSFYVSLLSRTSRTSRTSQCWRGFRLSEMLGSVLGNPGHGVAGGRHGA